MSKDTGGPAFPNVPDGAGDKWIDWDMGMTLRDWMAGMAMQGDWACQGDRVDNGAEIELLDVRARVYYLMADAMIAERSR